MGWVGWGVEGVAEGARDNHPKECILIYSLECIAVNLTLNKLTSGVSLLCALCNNFDFDSPASSLIWH